MVPDFFNLSYLATGSAIQQRGLHVIRESNVMEILKGFQPVLAGTLPLDLFTEGSDLDILCSSPDMPSLEKIWIRNFQQHQNFSIHSKRLNTVSSLIARFSFENFKFELVAQGIATEKQTAYRHLVKEFMILENYGDDFRQKIRMLKKQGIKTEPAFAALLNLEGDPYEAILNCRIS